MKYIVTSLLILTPLAAQAVDFEAGIGPTIHDRCHMDFCEFSTIQASVPISVQRDGTMFAVSGQSWGARYERRPEPSDEYARPPKSVDPKQPFLLMVFCSKVRPYVFYFNKDTGWQADALKPGDDEAISGADESAYQDYWAACHHFFPKDPYDPLVHKLAPKLGYHFRGGPPDGDDAITQPSDLLTSDRVAKVPGSHEADQKTGDVTLLGAWQNFVRAKIAGKVSAVGGAETRTATVTFTTYSNGQIGAVALVQASGSDQYDAMVLNAVKLAVPLPASPDGAEHTFRIRIKFSK